MFRDRWIRGGCIAAAFFMAAVVFVGAKTVAGVPLFPAPLDKAAHFVYYGLMAGLLAYGLGRSWLWVPLVLVPVVGAMDEWYQSMIPGRDASFWDWTADEIGTLVFVYLYWRWPGASE